jgi:hypothetical protein
MRPCTFVQVDAYGDRAKMAFGSQIWTQNYQGPAVAGLAG